MTTTFKVISCVYLAGAAACLLASLVHWRVAVMRPVPDGSGIDDSRLDSFGLAMLSIIWPPVVVVLLCILVWRQLLRRVVDPVVLWGLAMVDRRFPPKVPASSSDAGDQISACPECHRPDAGDTYHAPDCSRSKARRSDG